MREKGRKHLYLIEKTVFTSLLGDLSLPRAEKQVVYK